MAFHSGCFFFSRSFSRRYYYSYCWIPRSSEMCSDKIWITINRDNKLLLLLLLLLFWSFNSLNRTLIRTNSSQAKWRRKYFVSIMDFISMQFYAKFQATETIRWMTLNCIMLSIFRSSFVQCQQNTIKYALFLLPTTWPRASQLNQLHTQYLPHS